MKCQDFEVFHDKKGSKQKKEAFFCLYKRSGSRASRILTGLQTGGGNELSETPCFCTVI